MITVEELITEIKLCLLKKYDVKPGEQVRLSSREKVMEPYIDNKPIGIVNAVHTHLNTLEFEGLIQIKWKTPELIQYITLKEADRLADLMGYELLKYKSLHTIEHLKSVLKESYHYRLLANGINAQLTQKGRYEGFSIDEPNALIESIRVADALWERSLSEALEIDERHFSSEILGDSKRFTAIRSRVAKIIKLASPLFEDMDVQEVFRYHGVVPIIHPVFISGELILHCDNGEPITANFPPSIGVWPDYIANISGQVKTLTTIENLATFNRYVRFKRTPDEVVFYTAGIPSPAIRKIYSMLVSLNPITVRHWGDIDLGGFTILKILEKTAKRAITAYKMSYEDYIGIENKSELTKQQSARLEGLAKSLSDDNQQLAIEVARQRKTFEQESYRSWE